MLPIKTGREPTQCSVSFTVNKIYSEFRDLHFFSKLLFRQPALIVQELLMWMLTSEKKTKLIGSHFKIFGLLLCRYAKLTKLVVVDKAVIYCC